jgi:hypothetical protein
LTRYGVTSDPKFGVPLVANALVDTWRFDTTPPVEEANVHAGLYAAVSVEPTPGDRIDVVGSLGSSIIGVSRIIDSFAHLFPPVAEPLDLSGLVRTWGQSNQENTPDKSDAY